MTLADERIARRTASLALAQKRRIQARALKDAMREDAFNPYDLIEGKGPEVLEQEVVRFLKLYRLLPMVRGIGVSKAHEIIEAFGLPPETRMGDISQERRRDLALIVRGAREMWTAPAHEIGKRYLPDRPRQERLMVGSGGSSPIDVLRRGLAEKPTPSDTPASASASENSPGTDTPTDTVSTTTSGLSFQEEIERMVCESWIDRLHEAYSLARAERLNTLRGKYVPRRNAMGMDPYSFAWGQIMACEFMVPWLSDLRFADDTEGYCTPYDLRQYARQDADRTFAHELLERERKER